MFRKDFIEIIATKLKKDGVINLLTDHKEFKEFVIKNIEQTGYLKKINIEENPLGLNNYPETNYMRKWRKMKKPIFFLQYKVKKNCDTWQSPVVVKNDISNIEIKKKMEIDEIASILYNYSYSKKSVFHITRVFKEKNKKELLLFIIVKEKYLLQRLYVKIKITHNKTLILLLNRDHILFTSFIQETLKIIKALLTS